MSAESARNVSVELVTTPIPQDETWVMRKVSGWVVTWITVFGFAIWFFRAGDRKRWRFNPSWKSDGPPVTRLLCKAPALGVAISGT